MRIVSEKRCKFIKVVGGRCQKAASINGFCMLHFGMKPVRRKK